MKHPRVGRNEIAEEVVKGWSSATRPDSEESRRGPTMESDVTNSQKIVDECDCAHALK